MIDAIDKCACSLTRRALGLHNKWFFFEDFELQFRGADTLMSSFVQNEGPISDPVTAEIDIYDPFGIRGKSPRRVNGSSVAVLTTFDESDISKIFLADDPVGPFESKED